MHIGRSYGAIPFLRWTRRRTLLLVASAVLLAGLYQVAGWRWLVLPWPVLAMLGTAASFIVGFKNAQTYGRSVEGQQIWTAITAGSRYWGLVSCDFPVGVDAGPALIRRHLAWLTAVRYQLRQPRVWEAADDAPNAEYRQQAFVVSERTVPLAQALAPYLAPDAITAFIGRGAAPMDLIRDQSRALRDLYADGKIAVLHHTEMQRTLKDLVDQHARAERLKNFPYPRQYAIINTVFVWAFALLLPLGVVREFAQLGGASIMQGYMGWLAVPFSVLIGWMYVGLDQVGTSTENPFEGGANDVPITHLCAVITADLLAMLGEGVDPVTIDAADHIVS